MYHTNSRVFLLIVALLLFQFLLSLAQNIRAGRCVTPEGVGGNCVVLSECPALLRLLQPPVNLTNLRRLQQSTCDASGNEPKVCCGSSTPTQPSSTSTTTTTKPPLPATDILKRIVNHKNLALLPNSETCGKLGFSGRIAGGTEAGLGTYPWMVLIGFVSESEGGGKAKNNVIFGCGGTLINPRYILTAAHCVAELPPGYSPVTVRVGSYNQSSEIDCEPRDNVCAPHYQDMVIEETIPHKDYDVTQKKENDIALIRLKNNVAYNPFVTPICLPHGERLQKTESSVRALVAGWGRTTADVPDMSQILQHVSVPFQPMSKCNEMYGASLGHDVDDGRFCAGGEKGKDSCKGDSGGPLMVVLKAKNADWALRCFQFGIVSIGPVNCDMSEYPALYTKVSHFMPWILDNLRP